MSNLIRKTHSQENLSDNDNGDQYDDQYLISNTGHQQPKMNKAISQVSSTESHNISNTSQDGQGLHPLQHLSKSQSYYDQALNNNLPENIANSDLHTKAQQNQKQQQQQCFEELDEQEYKNITSLASDSKEFIPQSGMHISQITRDLAKLQDINSNTKGQKSIINRIKMRVMPLVRGLSKHISKHSEFSSKNTFQVSFEGQKLHDDLEVDEDKSLVCLKNNIQSQNPRFVTIGPMLSKDKIYQFKFRKLAPKSSIKLGISYTRDVNDIYQKNMANIFMISQYGILYNYTENLVNNPKLLVRQKSSSNQELSPLNDNESGYDIVQIQFLEDDYSKITLKSSFEINTPIIYYQKNYYPSEDPFYICFALDVYNTSFEIEKAEELMVPTLLLKTKHWLESSDPKHRYGNFLNCYFKIWKKSNTNESFFYWLDQGEGKDVQSEMCSRDRLNDTCVEYVSKDNRENNRVVVRNGVFYFKKNWQPVHTVYEGKDKDASNEDQKWIFVLSVEYKLYIHPKVRGKFHHTSFLGGAPVICAGNLIIDQGLLKEIKPHSGHYMPNIQHFNRYLWILEKNCKVDMTKVDIGKVKDPSKKKKKTKY